MICGSGGSKSRLAKAAGAESQLARWEMKNCAPLWHEAHLQVKKLKTPHVRRCSEHFLKLRCRKSARRCGTKHMSKSKVYKTHQVRSTFWSCDVEKVHGVVARSTSRSQNVQNTPAPEHFWKLRCRKSACRCGAKHILEVNMYKTHQLQLRTTFGSWDVENVHAAVARSTFRSQNVKSTTCSDHFWTFRCRFA